MCSDAVVLPVEVEKLKDKLVKDQLVLNQQREQLLTQIMYPLILC